MKMPKLIVLMSGRGQRFVNEGYTTPKPLIEAANKPMLAYVMDLFGDIKDVTFVCNEQHMANSEFVAGIQKLLPINGTILTVPVQNEGPCRVIEQIEDQIKDDDEIIISYCDYGGRWNFDSFLEDARKCDGMVACYAGFHPHMISSHNYAYCRMDPTGCVAEVREKQPFTSKPMSEYASNGTYYFRTGKILKEANRKLLDSGIKVNGEYYVSMVYNHIISAGLRVGVHVVEKMVQLGTPHDLRMFTRWAGCHTEKWHKQEYPTNTVLVLPMAGHGSRFSEVGYQLPKPLLPVDGSPMIVSAVECLPSTSRQVFVALRSHVVDHGVDSKIKEAYPNAEVIGIDRTTEGQACTCAIALDSVNPDSSILISACDNGVRYDQKKYQDLLAEDPDVVVWAFTNNPASRNNPNMYSWLDIDAEGNVLSVSSKKFPGGDPLKQYAIIGTFYFKTAQMFRDAHEENLRRNIRTSNEFFVDDAISRCIDRGLKVKMFPVEHYICWGTPEDYQTYLYWQNFFGAH